MDIFKKNKPNMALKGKVCGVEESHECESQGCLLIGEFGQRANSFASGGSGFYAF